MPLYAGELNIRRGAPLAEYPAPMSEVLRAQSEETQLHNPTQALRRMLNMTDAERGEVLPPESDMDAEIRRAPVTRLDAETARNRVKEEGLKLTIPDDGISERALDILMRRKREEMRRQDIFSRGPSGIGPGAARLGTALVESLFDPLNIASAFVPVVGPARYAAMVRAAASPLSRAAIRAEVGALEGAVGAAILEPLIYSAAQQEQLDYTMYDSLANIAFGGVFGGGLHVGAGAVRDVVQPNWWRTVPEGIEPESARAIAVTSEPEVHQAALRTSVVQAVEGRPVEVAPIVEQPRIQRDPITDADVRAAALSMRAEIGHAERGGRVIIDEATRDVTPGTGDVLGRTVWVGHRWWFDRPDKGLDATKAKRALEKWETGKRLGAREQRFIDYVQEEVRHRMDAERMDDLPAVIDDISAVGLDPVAKNATDADLVARAAELDEIAVERAAIAYENDDSAFMAEIRRILNEQGQETTGGSQANRAAAQAAARAEETRLTPEALQASRVAAERNAVSVRAAEPEAAAAAELQAKSVKGDDLADAEDAFEQSVDAAEEFADALGLDVRESLRPFAEAVARTDDYAKALKAAAACGVA